MVRGLDVFRTHFEAYQDRYVLIGGTACSLVMEDAGLDFRATRDLDIVLCIEALDSEFTLAFWQFIHNGRYQNRQRSTGKKLFYRFFDPEDQTFPVMLELFSRIPNVLSIRGEGHLTPIPVDEDASSLSAILLDNEYYHFIHAGKRLIGGLPVVTPAHLIPLKVRAWLDLRARQGAGEQVDSKDIRKHLNDVFRLYQLLSLETMVPLSGAIREDFLQFVVAPEIHSLDLKSLGIRRTSLEEAIGNLKKIYGCSL